MARSTIFKMSLWSLRWLVLTLFCVSVAIGCNKQGNKAELDGGKISGSRRPAPPPRLVSDKELKMMEKELMSAVARNRNMKCPRPALRGTAKVGSANEDMIAVIEGNPENKLCHKLLKKWSEALSKALYLPKQKLPKVWPKRYRNTARPLDGSAAVFANFDALQKSCAPTIKRMRAATMYGEVCSPYLPGKRGLPKFLPQLTVAKFVALQAHQLLKNGKMRDALELLLDGMRFNQDMVRGDSTMIGSMISVAAIGFLVPIVELALNTPKPLGDELLKQVERELTLLLKNEPHPLSILKGEHLGQLLTMVLPHIKGPGWTPPGGWGAEPPPQPSERKKRRDKAANALGLKVIDSGIDPRDEWGLIWLAGRLTMADWIKACPKTKAPITCYQGMRALAKKLGPGSFRDATKMMRLVSVGTADKQLRKIRAQIIRILRAVAAPNFQKYIARQGFIRFELAALRMHAGYRRLAEKQKKCPGLAAFDQQPLKALRMNPFDNKSIRIQASGSDRYLLTPAPPLTMADKPQQGPAIVITCSR